MTMTTIKVDSDLRDRINDAARTRGVTAGALLRDVFGRWDREQRFAAIREAMARTPPERMASYLAEAAEWDATAAGDGLREEPPYGADPHPAGR